MLKILAHIIRGRPGCSHSWHACCGCSVLSAPMLTHIVEVSLVYKRAVSATLVVDYWRLIHFFLCFVCFLILRFFSAKLRMASAFMRRVGSSSLHPLSEFAIKRARIPCENQSMIKEAH